MRYTLALFAAFATSLLICSPVALVIYARHWQVAEWQVAAVVAFLYVVLLVLYVRLFASRKGVR